MYRYAHPFPYIIVQSIWYRQPHRTVYTSSDRANSPHYNYCDTDLCIKYPARPWARPSQPIIASMFTAVAKVVNSVLTAVCRRRMTQHRMCTINSALSCARSCDMKVEGVFSVVKQVHKCETTKYIKCNNKLAVSLTVDHTLFVV